MGDTERGFVRLAGFCAIVAPLLQAAAGVMQHRPGMEFEWTIVFWLAFVFYVPAIFGLIGLARSAGSRLAPYAGAIAYVGAMAGASMQILFRTRAVLTEAGQAAGVQALDTHTALSASTMYIGILFPIGSFLLALCLLFSRAVPRVGALLLAAGAIAFPVGHAMEVIPAQYAANLLMVIAYGFIGLHMMRLPARTEIAAP